MAAAAIQLSSLAKAAVVLPEMPPTPGMAFWGHRCATHVRRPALRCVSPSIDMYNAVAPLAPRAGCDGDDDAARGLTNLCSLTGSSGGVRTVQSAAAPNPKSYRCDEATRICGGAQGLADGVAHSYIASGTRVYHTVRPIPPPLARKPPHSLTAPQPPPLSSSVARSALALNDRLWLRERHPSAL